MKRPPPDLHLFREAMADAIPLPPDNRAQIERPKPKPQRRAASATEGRTSGHADPTHGLSDRLGDDEMPDEFARSGISRQTLRELKRGRWPIEAELDLHGATREAARHALTEFLNESRAHDLRVVRIIHGRGLRSPDGTAVLKALVRGWLMQLGAVLAYRQAAARDGGEGALIVLLKSAPTPER